MQRLVRRVREYVDIWLKKLANEVRRAAAAVAEKAAVKAPPEQIEHKWKNWSKNNWKYK